jgi:hypothetical protein
LCINNFYAPINTFQQLSGSWSDAAANFFNTYLLSAGTYTWYAAGANAKGQLGQGPGAYVTTKTTALTAISGNWERLIAADGDIIGDGTAVYGLSAGTQYKWSSMGDNYYGQLGQSYTTAEVSALSRMWPITGRWSNIVAGQGTAYALSADPDSKGIYRWHYCGSDWYGQLGASLGWPGTTFGQRIINTFTPMTGNWQKIVPGNTYTLAKSAGTNKWFAAGDNRGAGLGLGSSVWNTSAQPFLPIPGTFDDMFTASSTIALTSYTT